MAAGWGRASVQGSLPGAVRLLADRRTVRTGARRTHRVEVAHAGRLRAVLAWYDPPGERLVNDLDLTLDDSQGHRTFGNHPPGERGTPDRANPVEVIDIEVPAGGCTLTVTGANVPDGPQPYALAIAAPAIS
jgi:hypothetical protein